MTPPASRADLVNMGGKIMALEIAIDVIESVITEGTPVHKVDVYLTKVVENLAEILDKLLALADKETEPGGFSIN